MTAQATLVALALVVLTAVAEPASAQGLDPAIERAVAAGVVDANLADESVFALACIEKRRQEPVEELSSVVTDDELVVGLRDRLEKPPFDFSAS